MFWLLPSYAFEISILWSNQCFKLFVGCGRLYCCMVPTVPFYCPTGGGTGQKASQCPISQSGCRWAKGRPYYYNLVLVVVLPIFSRFEFVYLVSFLKLPSFYLQEVAAEFEVEAMPTFLFLKDGKVVHKIVGANKDELTSTVAKLGAESAVSTAWIRKLFSFSCDCYNLDEVLMVDVVVFSFGWFFSCLKWLSLSWVIIQIYAFCCDSCFMWNKMKLNISGLKYFFLWRIYLALING